MKIYRYTKEEAGKEDVGSFKRWRKLTEEEAKQKVVKAKQKWYGQFYERLDTNEGERGFTVGLDRAQRDLEQVRVI